MNYTAAQVLQLSPDADSAKRGSQLAKPAQWGALGSEDGTALWGECKGSGAKPYRSIIDLQGPAFKCSCPSRKFPCKHGIGMFLLFVQQPSLFPSASPPDWAADWLGRRRQRAEAATRPVSEEEQAKRAKAKAKRADARMDNVVAAMGETGEWIRDLIRTGLSQLDGKSGNFAEAQAARLVDAQGGSLANMVRRAGHMSKEDGWQRKTLRELAMIHLLSRAYGQFDSLPPQWQDELRHLAGMSPRREELLTQEGVRDVWRIMSVRILKGANLYHRDVWLQGKDTGRLALMEDYEVSAGAFTPILNTGEALDAELVFMPTLLQRRAIMKHHAQVNSDHPPAFHTLEQGLQTHADALVLNPWLDNTPWTLDNATLIRQEGKWRVCTEGRSIPSLIWNDDALHWLSVTGGKPCGVFGQWHSDLFWPFSIWLDGKMITLPFNDRDE